MMISKFRENVLNVLEVVQRGSLQRMIQLERRGHTTCSITLVATTWQRKGFSLMKKKWDIEINVVHRMEHSNMSNDQIIMRKIYSNT